MKTISWFQWIFLICFWISIHMLVLVNVGVGLLSILISATATGLLYGCMRYFNSKFAKDFESKNIKNLWIVTKIAASIYVIVNTVFISYLFVLVG